MSSSVAEPSAPAMQKTPLNEWHKKLGASMVPFSGWEMPIQYEGILAEHQAVRQSVGLFDISHMGTVDVSGLDALAFVQNLITNDARRLADGKALYSPVCRPDGGVVDDVLVYRMGDKRYRFVINAGNRQKDFAWMVENSKNFHVEFRVLSEEISLLAVQGPRSAELLQSVLGLSMASLHYYCFFYVDWRGEAVMVSRTGYTGELGFELFVPTALVADLWQTLLDKGGAFGIKPIGLGARDTLRLEMGYCLYGHEINEKTNPLEAGLAWTVALDKPAFIGKDALLAQKKAGLARKLVGLKADRGIPRADCEIVQDGRVVGMTTSGSFSPSLKQGIALGYVPKELAAKGQRLAVRIRRQDQPATVVQVPFYEKKAAQ